jgi:hypothetical protein
MQITWDQALAWRMHRHYLIDRASPKQIVEVVSRLRGLHAQVMSSVDLALWARMDGLRREDVSEALWKKRTLVKMWAMRATLHVLPAADLGTWIGGLSIWKPGVWPLKDPGALPVARHIDKALRGKTLNRTELADAVAKLGATPKMVEAMLGNWSSSLRYASFVGSLCVAPSESAEGRFTHPATWLRKAAKKVDSDKAFDALTIGYLAAYGPATPHDLGPRWWGVNQGEAKRRFAAVGDAATQVAIEGKKYWMLTQDVAELAATEPVGEVVRLLPAFDQWTVCASRRVPAFVSAKYHQRIYRLQGWVSAVVLVNGRMVGIWKHEQKGRVVSVEIEPFDKLPRWARAQIEAESERLAAFLDADLKLTIGR